VATKRAAAAVRLAARRRQAWDLFVGERLTFEQIGARLGCGSSTAWRHVVDHRDALVREQLLDVDMLRARQLGGVSALVTTHWKNRRRKSSADVILSAWTREAKLMGLDAYRPDVYSADQVANVLRGIAALFMEIVADPEQRRAFSIGLRRKVGALAAQAGINGNGGNGHGAAKPVGHGSTAPVDVGAGPEKEQQR